MFIQKKIRFSGSLETFCAVYFLYMSLLFTYRAIKTKLSIVYPDNMSQNIEKNHENIDKKHTFSAFAEIPSKLWYLMAFYAISLSLYLLNFDIYIQNIYISLSIDGLLLLELLLYDLCIPICAVYIVSIFHDALIFKKWRYFYILSFFVIFLIVMNFGLLNGDSDEDMYVKEDTDILNNVGIKPDIKDDNIHEEKKENSIGTDFFEFFIEFIGFLLEILM